TIGARAFPDGREAVIKGRLVAQSGSAEPHLLAVDVETGQTRRLLDDDSGFSDMLAVLPDGQSLLATQPAGDLVRLVVIPRNGRGKAHTLLTSFPPAGGLDVAADGTIYAAEVDFPIGVVRIPLGGGRTERIGALRSGIGLDTLLGTA